MGEVNEWYQLREWNSTFDYSKLVGYHEIWTADLHRGSRTVVKTGVLELVKLHDNKKKITKRKEVEVCVCVCRLRFHYTMAVPAQAFVSGIDGSRTKPPFGFPRLCCCQTCSCSARR